LQTIFLISLGAIIGANLRYLLARSVARLVVSSFPWGTINLSASFILGLFLIWTTERVVVDPRWRSFIVIGFCATYSTYSSFAFETLVLIERNQWLNAVVYVLITNAWWRLFWERPRRVVCSVPSKLQNRQPEVWNAPNARTQENPLLPQP